MTRTSASGGQTQLRVRRIAWLMLAAGCSTALPAARAGGIDARSAAHDAASADRFPTGCYRADRILGMQARAEPGLASHGLDTFQLLPDGAVARPGVPTASDRAMWAGRSGWALRGDTLEVRLSNGFSGWALRLDARSGGREAAFTGMARYISDAVVRDTTGWNSWPPRFPVPVMRERCPTGL